MSTAAVCMENGNPQTGGKGCIYTYTGTEEI